MIFKPASVTDFIVAFVFSSLWFYYPLSIMDCDLNANVEDRGYFEKLAGTDQDVNHILATFDDVDHEIVNFCNSCYITFSDIASIFQNSHNEFITLSLNVQSIHAKFNQFYPIVRKLSSMGLYFGAICLQETWLASDADLSLLQLPTYNIIHQSSKCSKHGRLIIYLSEMYSFKLRNLCNDSDIWEGLFIEVMGHNLRKPLTICNMYHPPHDNDNNDNISKFLSELSPVLDILQKENSYAAIVGDFNINLLQINERENMNISLIWCAPIAFIQKNLTDPFFKLVQPYRSHFLQSSTQRP